MYTRMLFTTKFVRSAIALWVALLPLSLMSGTALAAGPPPNDTLSGAEEVFVGWHYMELDTEVLIEATNYDDDDQLKASSTCEFWGYEASVWYKFTALANDAVSIDASYSWPSAGILVGVESPDGGLVTVACGSGPVVLAEKGTTYYVMAFLESPVEPIGGRLGISFNIPGPPPTMDITVDRYGQVNASTGIATFSGTYTCSNAGWVLLNLSARQNVGRFTISGGGSFQPPYDPNQCDGTPQPWAVEAKPQNGKFAGGKSMIHLTDASACGDWGCTSVDTGWQTVQLRGGNK